MSAVGKGVQRIDAVQRAKTCWPVVPDWVLALATACNQSSQSAVARRIGYSAPTISQVISNTYPGNIERVADMVRGALLAATVDCPVIGEIGRDRCLQEQDEPFRATSAFRAQLFHACRSGCPFSKHTKTRESFDAEG